MCSRALSFDPSPSAATRKYQTKPPRPNAPNKKNTTPPTNKTNDNPKILDAKKTSSLEEEGKPPRDVSVAAYFQTRYGTPLQHPYLPCVDVSADRARRVWLPMEVCVVAPGQRRRVLDDRQTAAMLSFAGLRPGDRRAYLADLLARPEMLCLSRDPTAKAFGVEVETALQTVGARVLPPPRLAYGAPACIDPGTRGAWNLKDVRFPGGSKIESWAVCCLMPQPDGKALCFSFVSGFSFYGGWSALRSLSLVFECAVERNNS